MLLDLLVDVPELRIPVRVPLALDRLGVALQAEPLGPQQVTDGVGADPVPLAGSAPPASLRVDFVVHRSGDIGSPRSSGSTRASSAGRSPGSRSAGRLRPPPGRRARPSGSAPESSSATPRDTVASRTPGGPGHQPDPAMAQRAGLSTHQQPPLPLIQMREDRHELRRQRPHRFLCAAHTTSACRIPGSYGLFFCKL